MLKQPIDFTVDQACSRCGNCCSSLIPVSDAEISALVQYVKHHRIEPAKTPDNADMVYMQCPFWHPDERVCAVYPVRPVVCRMFQCNKPISDMVETAGQDITGRLKVQNMWQIYGKTGIRIDNEDIPYCGSPYVEVITDQNQKLKITVGRPATIVANDGKTYANALVISLRPQPPAIGIIDPDRHKAEHIPFSSIKALAASKLSIRST